MIGTNWNLTLLLFFTYPCFLQDLSSYRVAALPSNSLTRYSGYFLPLDYDVINDYHCSYIGENLMSRQRVLNLLQLFTFPAYESSP